MGEVFEPLAAVAAVARGSLRSLPLAGSDGLSTPPAAVPASTESFTAFCARVGLDLEPFQVKIARAALTGPPELLVLLPRGNGKTTLLAALAVHHLLTDATPAVYIAAASRDQARILYEMARTFAERAGGLVIRHLEIRAPSGHLRVLAADAPKVHGLTPSLAIIDELHAHKDDELYLALRTALHKRPGARMVVISTAGHGPETPLGRLHARALGLPSVKTRGALTDARGPRFRMLDWSVAPDVPLDDWKAVKRANPASWITRDALEGQREALPELAYRRYHLNQWVAPEGAWLPAGAWQACEGVPTFTDGEPIWVGVDVGGERSASAVVWVNESLHVGVAIFHGDEGVLECVAEIDALAERFRLVEVVFDPWRFGQASQELQARGVPVVAFPQSDARMIPASDRVYRAIVEGRLTLPDDAELRAHAHTAIARHSRRGWRIDKVRGSDNIDAVIALAMALERADDKAEPVALLGWI